MMIKKDWIKQNAIIIDIGITKITDQSFDKGYKIVGDVDFEDVNTKVSAITLVLGGIGPMTINALMEQIIKAAELKL